MSSMSGATGYSGGGGVGNRSGDIIPKGYSKGKLQQYDPQQMELYNRQFGEQGVGPGSYMSRLAGGDKKLFDEMEAPAHRQFNEQLGGIANRFSGQGIGGRHSSGFQNTNTAAASNFAQDLAARRQELQGNAIKDLFSMSQQLLGDRPEDQFLVEKYKKPKTGGWGSAASGAASGALAGDPLGPWGIAAGGVAGGAAGYFS